MTLICIINKDLEVLAKGFVTLPGALVFAVWFWVLYLICDLSLAFMGPDFRWIF